MEWVRISLPCERALTTHLKATASQCYSNLDATSTIIWPNWILDLDLDLDLDSLPTPLFLFLFLFRSKLYSIKENFFEQRCFDACDFLLCYELPGDIILPPLSLLPILTTVPCHAMCCGVWPIKCR
jgi:hypothetical protein